MAKEQLFKSYVSTAAILVKQYDGSIPFNDFLKKYFALHKKYGSRDRKNIAHLCYCFYRNPNPLRNHPLKVKLKDGQENYTTEERILIGLFLCSVQPNELLQSIKPEWNERVHLSAEAKLALLGNPFLLTDIFPWQNELSESIDGAAFAASHLIQPDLFLRIRPAHEKHVIQKLQAANIAFEINDSCIALPNNTKIDGLLAINKEAVVQDYSSQRISEFFSLIKLKTENHKLKTWDCCAASGGKAILAFDTLKNMTLTVSDIRASIIHNLRNRFKEAGIHNYQSYEIDLTKPVSKALSLEGSEGFDLIICDAPCTGSGTWGRTPEQLYFFKEDKIEYYASLQKSIAGNALKCLKQGGYFLYITCSVFKNENEDVVDFILSNENMKLLKQEALIGYNNKADTMFAALFIRG